ncbi:MAG: hypothetical protein GY819_05550 [Planctomycetaceae bacterium]|nr:hypothetical protein [Planctomycetaceae bacterium]MCP4462249.1 hypothetical protein [Planctomycetaceae bacterium]MDG1808381.1 hypothetical protein [Pirellulaceae bacterium]MDG2105574.1 hypothetical protein [Pirellulaceae bacterium]
MQKKLEQVRLQIERWVKTHACQAAAKPWRESILLKDGCLHGYRFCIGSVEAVWLIEQLTVELRRDGRLADTLAIAESEATRYAA